MFGIFSIDTAKLAAIFVVGAGGIYLAVKHADSLVSEASITDSDDDLLDIEECKQVVKDWAEEELSSRQNIAFRWDIDKFGSTKLDKWDELIRYVYVQNGPNNRETLFFVNASTGDFLGWQQIEYDIEHVDPFSYCDYVQEYRDEQRRATMSYAGRRQYQRQRPRDRLSLKDGPGEETESPSDQSPGE